MTRWPADLESDYAGAAVRIATAIEAGVSHLLFGVVELFPREVPLPPPFFGDFLNLGPVRLVHSCTVLSVSDALLWYEAAATGRVNVPGKSFTVKASPLGAEPMLGRLVAGADVPFAPVWHAGPRLHRLIPLMDLAPTVSALAASENANDRQRTARSWLAERLHFDLLAYDDWMGALALLAPNPASRAFRVSLAPSQLDGQETIRVSAPPRRGVLTGSLSIRLRDIRFGGWTNARQVDLDPFGNAEVSLPEPVQEVVVELECAQRGLLAVAGPHGFVRSIGGNVDIVSGGTVIEVPSPRRADKPTSYRREVRSSQSFSVRSTQMPAAAQRLIGLQQHRRRRTGDAGPDDAWTGRTVDERIFHDDRAAAANFIRQLIQRARNEIVMVDPFFDHVALREFALATAYRGVKVRILLGRDHLRNEIAMADGRHAQGAVLLGELRELKRRSATYNLPVPDLRLMGVSCRKYHDRFLVADNEVWQCGHSFNQVGRGEVSMMTRLRHPDLLRIAILADLDAGDAFEDAWPKMEAETRAPRAKADFGDLPCAHLALWTAWWEAGVTAWTSLLSCGIEKRKPDSSDDDGAR